MTGVIFLQKNKFDIYTMPPGRVSEFLFVPEVIKELDIIDRDLLDNLVKLFVTNNKIPACNLVIIIAENACFTRDIQLQSPDSEVAVEDIAKEFVDSVPYEKIASRNFPLQRGIRAFAVNEDFYLGIVSAFEKMGFKIDGVYPGLAFGNLIGKDFVLSSSNSELVLSTARSQGKYNLLLPEERAENEQEDHTVGEGVSNAPEQVDDYVIEKEEPVRKKSNKRLFLMIGVFLVLIIILIITILNQS